MTDPITTLHYTSGSNIVGGNGVYAYAPGVDGFNLADVSSLWGLNQLPAGVKGLAYLGMTDGVTDAFKAAVNQYLGNPKLYGFYLADEPDPTQVSAANLMAEADYIHANFPGAITYITLQNMGTPTSPVYNFNPQNTHIDLFGLDPYPVRPQYSGGMNLSVIPDAVNAALAAGIPLGKIVPVYQAFGGGGYASWTVPTADQERQILSTWGAYVPNPVFDYAYSWGVQNSDTAISTDPDLQKVFASHNALGDTTPPAQPAITGAAYTNNLWTLSGKAEPGSQVAIYDAVTLLGSVSADAFGAWSYTTNENNSAVRDYSVTATDAAGNTSIVSAPYLEGTPGNDIFSIASEATLAAAAGIYGNGGTDTIQLAAATLTDADLAHVSNVQNLALTGASSVTLGANAARAGIATVITGNGTTSIADSNSGTLTVNAASLLSSASLSLSGSESYTVTGLQSNLAASNVTGSLNVTTGAVPALSIATGSGANTINAGAFTQGEALTLIGSSSASVTVGGNLSAGAYSGKLSVIASGSTPHSITTGSGKDSVTASNGGDMITAGVGGDSINVSGHTAADTFAYQATSDSTNTSSGHDIIAGFSATGNGAAFNDVIDLSAVAGISSVEGGLTRSSQTVAAHSIAWIFNASTNQTMVYANATNSALSQSSSSLMLIDLAGGNLHLSANNFRP